MAVSLRAATQADLTFAYDVTESVMRGHVERTWGAWTPAQQRAYHEKSFATATHSIILVDGVAAGIIAVSDHADHVQLEKLYLLPEFQNRGIGSELLRQVLKRGRDARKPIRLRVLAVNEAAQRFYARHGFRTSGATRERVFMEASDI